MGRKLLSREVFAWPEFKALACRLGVENEKCVRSFGLRLHLNECAVIEIERFPEEREEEPAPPSVQATIASLERRLAGIEERQRYEDTLATEASEY